MLIRASGSSPYIFLSNTKAASTSIHGCQEITKDCELRIWSSRLGKHLGLKQIIERYHFLFNVVPLDKFAIIMVIREPLDWFMSWYRYRQCSSLRDHPRTSYGMSPEVFFP